MAEKDHIASVDGKGIPVSTKHTIEISNFIRGKNLKKSIDTLGRVMEKKIAVPFTRYNRNVGHKPGKMAGGRYPVKAVYEVIRLLKSVESNAQNKGLNVDTLYISEIVANRASRPFHAGRWRRRKMKRTHLKIVVQEHEEKKGAKKEVKKEVPKEVKKAPAKKTVQPVKKEEKKDGKQ